MQSESVQCHLELHDICAHYIHVVEMCDYGALDKIEIHYHVWIWNEGKGF